MDFVKNDRYIGPDYIHYDGPDEQSVVLRGNWLESSCICFYFKKASSRIILFGADPS